MTIDETFAPPSPSRVGQFLNPPVRLPDPRGPLTVALLAYLRRDPETVRVDPARLTWRGRTADAALDDDLQLAMWLVYQLGYRGLAGIDDDWEWHPALTEAMLEWEWVLYESLAEVTQVDPDDRDDGDDDPSLLPALLHDLDVEQFREFLIHRSVYRLDVADEYRLGLEPSRQAQRLQTLLAEWDLEVRPGHYADRVPAPTLLASNLLSLFGLHRRFSGARIGHREQTQLTSAVLNDSSARAHRRLGGSNVGAAFFVEHVTFDEQVTFDEEVSAGGLDPADLHFGARCAAYADAAFADWVLPRWAAGTSSLLPTSRGLRFGVAS